jgi:GT2 family glycosyltransferase
MPISICLLNYNTYSDTIECIDSLLKQTVDNFDIIVIDNYSTNNSVEMIANHFNNKKVLYSAYTHNNSQFNCIKEPTSEASKIHLISNLENKGFSAGNNVAIRYSNAYLHNQELILLNNDTIVDSDFVELMDNEYNRFKSTHKSAIAMGATEKTYVTREISHTGFHYLNISSGFVFAKPVFPSFKYICGACLMFDNQVPLMDEKYFLYYDDADFSKSLIKKGYILCTTNKTCYFHKISSSIPDSTFKAENHIISMWRFYKKHYRFFVPTVFIIRFFQYLVRNKWDILKILFSTLKKTQTNV